MSIELIGVLIAVLTVGVALGGLIYTSSRSLRQDMARPLSGVPLPAELWGGMKRDDAVLKPVPDIVWRAPQARHHSRMLDQLEHAGAVYCQP